MCIPFAQPAHRETQWRENDSAGMNFQQGAALLSTAWHGVGTALFHSCLVQVFLALRPFSILAKILKSQLLGKCEESNLLQEL